MDRRHVTFMYSYPNYLPMKPSDVRNIRSRLEGYAFDDVFGFTWGRNIIGGAQDPFPDPLLFHVPSPKGS